MYFDSLGAKKTSCRALKTVEDWTTRTTFERLGLRKKRCLENRLVWWKAQVKWRLSYYARTKGVRSLRLMSARNIHTERELDGSHVFILLW